MPDRVMDLTGKPVAFGGGGRALALNGIGHDALVCLAELAVQADHLLVFGRALERHLDNDRDEQQHIDRNQHVFHGKQQVCGIGIVVKKVFLEGYHRYLQADQVVIAAQEQDGHRADEHRLLPARFEQAEEPGRDQQHDAGIAQP